MRSSITKGVEAILRQYELPEGTIVAKEKEKTIEINLPATKRKLYIPTFTATERVKTLIRGVLKEEETFQEAIRDARQKRLL